MLCDRIVCGIEDPKIQPRLLAELELTFDKAFELFLESEFADKNAKDLQLAKEPVHKLYTNCGEKHKSGDFHHKAAECHNCGKVLVCVRARVSLQREEWHAHIGARPISCPTNTLLKDNDDYSMYTLTGPPVKP